MTITDKDRLEITSIAEAKAKDAVINALDIDRRLADTRDMHQRLDTVIGTLGEHTEKFSSIDDRFDAIDQRFDRLETRMDAGLATIQQTLHTVQADTARRFNAYVAFQILAAILGVAAYLIAIK